MDCKRSTVNWMLLARHAARLQAIQACQSPILGRHDCPRNLLDCNDRPRDLEAHISHSCDHGPVLCAYESLRLLSLPELEHAGVEDAAGWGGLRECRIGLYFRNGTELHGACSSHNSCCVCMATKVPSALIQCFPLSATRVNIISPPVFSVLSMVSKHVSTPTCRGWLPLQ
jgi:hypothetical protein